MSCVLTIPHENVDELINSFSTISSGRPNEKSVQFFQYILQKKSNIAAILPDKFKRNATQLKADIHATHIDLAIASLYKQMELPEHSLESIDTFLLSNTMPDSTDIMKQLASHAFTSDSLGALERTLHVIDNLKLLIEKNSRNQFLKTIIGIIIFLNDQSKNSALSPGNNYRSNKTKRISKWIFSSFGIAEKSDLRKLIDFLVDRMVILGSITIFSPTRAMDLAELYFVFEDIAKQVGLKVIHESNERFLSDINAIMLAMSVCKKNPSALYDVVALQQNNNKTGTLSLLNRYYNKPLLLDQFFKSSHFHRYFGKRESLDHINQQAFLISLANQFTFQPENDQADEMATIIKFIDLSRKKAKTNVSDIGFIEWFEGDAVQLSLLKKVQNGFFTTIERRSTHRLSQVGSLVFVANKLISMGFQPRSVTVAATGLFQPLISPDVARIDAKNLKSLHQFFNQLQSTALQQQLANEILLAVVVQSEQTHAPISSNQKPNKLLVATLTPQTYNKNPVIRSNSKVRKTTYNHRFFAKTTNDQRRATHNAEPSIQSPP
ncbi:hypothetical protein N9Q05_01145 [bacterium]|nr:hypothetical protein [bacterium]